MSTHTIAGVTFVFPDDFDNYLFRDNLPRLIDAIEEASQNVAQREQSAQEFAEDAEQSAIDASMAAIDSLITTSSTNATITDNGDVIFTVDNDLPNKQFQVGMWLRSFYIPDPSKYMWGFISDIDLGADTITLTSSRADPTTIGQSFSNWKLYVTGPEGEAATYDFTALTAKATPVDADTLVINDSANSFLPKRLTLSGLWTWILAKINATPQLADINTQSGNYTFVLADGVSGRRIIDCTGTTGTQTITVPNNSAVVFPIGTMIQVCKAGAAAVIGVGASGVTLRSATGQFSILDLYGYVVFIKKGTNTWDVVGAV